MDPKLAAAIASDYWEMGAWALRHGVVLYVGNKIVNHISKKNPTSRLNPFYWAKKLYTTVGSPVINTALNFGVLHTMSRPFVGAYNQAVNFFEPIGRTVLTPFVLLDLERIEAKLFKYGHSIERRMIYVSNACSMQMQIDDKQIPAPANLPNIVGEYAFNCDANNCTSIQNWVQKIPLPSISDASQLTIDACRAAYGTVVMVVNMPGKMIEAASNTVETNDVWKKYAAYFGLATGAAAVAGCTIYVISSAIQSYWYQPYGAQAHGQGHAQSNANANPHQAVSIHIGAIGPVGGPVGPAAGGNQPQPIVNQYQGGAGPAANAGNVAPAAQVPAQVSIADLQQALRNLGQRQSFRNLFAAPAPAAQLQAAAPQQAHPPGGAPIHPAQP